MRKLHRRHRKPSLFQHLNYIINYCYTFFFPWSWMCGYGCSHYDQWIQQPYIPMYINDFWKTTCRFLKLTWDVCSITISFFLNGIHYIPKCGPQQLRSLCNKLVHTCKKKKKVLFSVVTRRPFCIGFLLCLIVVGNKERGDWLLSQHEIVVKKGNFEQLASIFILWVVQIWTFCILAPCDSLPSGWGQFSVSRAGLDSLGSCWLL